MKPVIVNEKPLCIKITGLMPLTFFNRTTMGAWLGITFPSVSCVLIHKCVTVSFFILLKKNWKLSPFSWLIFVGLWLNSFYCLYYDSFVWRIIVICIDHYTFFCWYYFFGKISSIFSNLYFRESLGSIWSFMTIISWKFSAVQKMKLMNNWIHGKSREQ